MFKMYYQIYSAFKFEDRDSGETKFMIKGNQVKSDGSLSQYQKYFVYSEDEFNSVFKKKYDLESYNLGIEGKILEVNMVPEPSDILDKVPEKK